MPVPEAVPLGRAVSAPGVGAPTMETPDAIGPTGADAEAPKPTKNPTPCYKGNKKCEYINIHMYDIGRTPEVVVFLALFRKAENVFPVAGALMEPTIPDHSSCCCC